MSRRKGGAAEAYDRARVEALWAKQAELGMSTAAFCAAEGLDARAYNRWKGLLLYCLAHPHPDMANSDQYLSDDRRRPPRARDADEHPRRSPLH